MSDLVAVWRDLRKQEIRARDQEAHAETEEEALVFRSVAAIAKMKRERILDMIMKESGGVLNCRHLTANMSESEDDPVNDC